MLKLANIAKNTSYLTLALIIQKIISFSYFILLARYLGLELLGQYYTALAFTTIFSIFIDLGFANILTREVAKKQADSSWWLRSIVAMKIVLSALTLVFGLTIAYFIYSPLILLLIAVSSLSMILDSFTATFFAVVRGFHNLKYESLASIIFQLIVLAFGLSFIRLSLPIAAFVLVIVFASTFNFLFSIFVVKKKLGLKMSPLWKIEAFRKILCITWPFALYNIFQRLFTYLDSLLLGFLAGYNQVGVYQIAFKLIFALQFLPMAFTASLYPAMSSYWQNNRAKLQGTFEKALNYLLILSVPIIFGVFSLADKISPLFKAGPEAVWPLRIAIIALVFIFLNFPVGSLLNACDRQKRNTWNMGIATALSVVLNIILIPQWQAIGASITVLISNAVMLVLGLFSLRGLIDYRQLSTFRVLLKTLLAAILMALLIYYIKQYLHVFLAVIIAGTLYFLALYLLGGFRREDIVGIINSFKKS